MKSPESCSAYQPSKDDPVVCVHCRHKWSEHSPDIRSIFTRVAPSQIVSMIEHRMIFTSQAKPELCLHWRPLKYREDLRVCVCGRLLREHNLKVIVNSKE